MANIYTIIIYYYSVNYFAFPFSPIRSKNVHVFLLLLLLYFTFTLSLLVTSNVCYRLRDVILHTAAFIIFTCALGLSLIHASVLWQQYQVISVYFYTPCFRKKPLIFYIILRNIN